jgi:hypothetical protein
MKAAVVWIMLGLSSSLLLGTRFLGMSAWEVAHSVVASNVAGFVGLLVTLWAERNEASRKLFRSRPLKSWGILTFCYFSILLLLAPQMRDWGRVAALFLPLMLTKGFVALAFGPLQDRRVRTEQRKRQEAAMGARKQG